MLSLIPAVLYSGVLVYIVYTINARVLDLFKLKAPLADTELKDVQDKLQELQIKVNAMSIQLGMREG